MQKNLDGIYVYIIIIYRILQSDLFMLENVNNIDVI